MVLFFNLPFLPFSGPHKQSDIQYCSGDTRTSTLSGPTTKHSITNPTLTALQNPQQSGSGKFLGSVSARDPTVHFQQDSFHQQMHPFIKHIKC